jgi:hypothetical protein
MSVSSCAEVGSVTGAEVKVVTGGFRAEGGSAEAEGVCVVHART